MDIKTGFASPELEQDGVWVDYRDDSRIKIARLGNPAWQRRYEALMKPYRRLERDNRMDPDKQSEIICRAYSETILLDWDGFTNDGKKFAYSKDNAFRLLRQHMDFRNDVTELAAEEDRFKQEMAEGSVKNSQAASTGD